MGNKVSIKGFERSYRTSARVGIYQPCETFEIRIIRGTAGQIAEEMIKYYLEHHFESSPNDNFKMEPE